MTKLFKTYQYMGGEMTERDKQEIGSKYWNEGKWNNFVLPHLIHLKDNLKEMTFIDIGCNAGLFLKLAEKYGFGKVIGVESDKGAYEKATRLGYQVINEKIENCFERLPMSDIVILVNTHYYILKKDWKKLINKLVSKTRYCLIVTAGKKPNLKYASSDVEGIKKDFRNWKLVSITDMPRDNTPHSRELHSLCFKSPLLERVLIDSLDNGNRQQRDFLGQLDEGVDVLETNYYRRLKSYRRHTGSRQETWSKERLIKYMNERVELYKDVKENGLKQPIMVVAKDNRIVDGNHRVEILKYLEHNSILINYVKKRSNNLH